MKASSSCIVCSKRRVFGHCNTFVWSERFYSSFGYGQLAAIHQHLHAHEKDQYFKHMGGIDRWVIMYPETFDLHLPLFFVIRSQESLKCCSRCNSSPNGMGCMLWGARPRGVANGGVTLQLAIPPLQCLILEPATRLLESWLPHDGGDRSGSL